MRQWPLVGRSREMEAIRTALARPGPSRGVVIVGAAGVGKSRLAREAANLLEAEGSRLRWLPATSASQQVPLGVFSGELDDLDGDPLRVCARAVELLVRDRTRAVVVDDAHRLDPLSAAVLLRLAVNPGVPMIVTVRAGEPVADAVAALWKDGYLDRVDLDPLSSEDAAAFLGILLDGPVDDESIRAFVALSGGNPLFLREIALGELRASRLIQLDGCWTWAGGFRASTPLTELVDSTALAVPDAVRAPLDLVAVVGDLDLDVALHCVDQAHVEAAEQAGLVVLDRAGSTTTVRAFHPLYAEVRRNRVGVLWARRWRGLAAAAMREVEVGGGSSLRQAALLLDSDVSAEPEVYAKAAEQAMRRLDYGLGERLAQAAVDAGGGFDVGMLLAFAQGWSNHEELATATCERMVRASTTDVERLRSSMAAAGHHFFTCGRPAEGLRRLDQGRLSVTEPDVGGLFDALQAFFSVCLGRPAEAVRLAERVLARPGLQTQLEVFALIGLVGGLDLGGRADRAVLPAERAWSVGATAFDAAHVRLGLMYLHVCGLVAAGYVRPALDLAERRGAEIVEGLVAAAMAGVFLGAAALASGDVARATTVLRRSAEILVVDTTGCQHQVTVFLARAYALAGAVGRAVETDALADTLTHPGHRWFEPERLLTKAWVAAAEGAVSEAVRVCRRAAAWAAEHEQSAHEVLALQTGTQLGDATGAGRLSRLAQEVDGPRAAVAARHAEALGRLDPERLLVVAGEYGAIDDRIAAADAYAQAAVRFALLGRPGARVDAARRAGELADECGVTTPALELALRPLPLAAREREVATMAAHGLTNRVIATRLHLSVRTVEGHLYRAYARLGVGSRAALIPTLRLGGSER